MDYAHRYQLMSQLRRHLLIAANRYLTMFSHQRLLELVSDLGSVTFVLPTSARLQMPLQGHVHCFPPFLRASLPMQTGRANVQTTLPLRRRTAPLLRNFEIRLTSLRQTSDYVDTTAHVREHIATSTSIRHACSLANETGEESRQASQSTRVTLVRAPK